MWALMASPGSLAAQEKGGAPPAVPVRVAPVTQQRVSEQITLIGSTEAASESIVAAEVAGIVEYFPVREGDFVEKGALLARLKATALKLRLKGAEAAIEKIQSDLRLAEKELQRYRRLKKSNSVAEVKYDEAINVQETLSQELIRQQAEVEQLRYDLRQKQVLAPFAGYVAAEHTQLGQWVQAGGPVITLVDLSQVRVTVDVPERYISGLAADAKAAVRIPSLSGESWNGRIRAVLPVGNPAARTIPVQVDLDNPGYRIKGGMEASVTFDLAGERDALLVPKDAVVPAGNDRMVYVVTDGTVAPVKVDVAGYYGGNAAVEGQLSAGMSVVTRGNERLRPGQAVQVVESPATK